MTGEERVDRLLADRENVPWAACPEGLRERTVAALSRRDGGASRWHVGGAIAAAVCVAGVTAVYFASEGPATPRPVAIRLDPAPLLGPALDQLAVRAERSMQSEARELLEDTERFTRRVIAQLPFTGGG